jgi:hypothetical protein
MSNDTQDKAAQALRDEMEAQGAPPVIAAAALGEQVKPSPGASREDHRKAMKAEKLGVKWLLEPRTTIRYKVPFKFETPVGTADLFAHITALDGRVIEKLERRATNERTGETDELAAAGALVAQALEFFADEDGEQVPLDEAFRTDPRTGEQAVANEDALLGRFRDQAGVLMMLAGEIRRVSGFSPDRVGTASRVLIEAVGNS